MRSLFPGLWAVASLFVLVTPARAQQFVVQEPTLETFGVGTTVSVPNGGRASVGGVRRSAASRSTYGPLRTGHSLGITSQGTGLSVQARIHDLAELDRAALEAAQDARRARDEYPLSPAAHHAYETLRARANVPDDTRGRLGPVGANMLHATENKVQPGDGPSAVKLLNRARQAEAAGRRGLALAYLRAARDRGSAPAQKEIDRLSREDR